MHYVYTMCLTGGVGILNQVKHGVLEINYHWIGPEDAFSVWTLEFLLENLGSKIYYYVILQMLRILNLFCT